VVFVGLMQVTTVRDVFQPNWPSDPGYGDVDARKPSTP
jgi:hypothetical protein